MFIMSYIGDQVWLMTSRQTEPDLATLPVLACCNFLDSFHFPLFLSISAVLVLVLGWCVLRAHLQLVDVWVEYAVREADARRLVGVLVG